MNEASYPFPSSSLLFSLTAEVSNAHRTASREVMVGSSLQIQSHPLCQQPTWVKTMCLRSVLGGSGGGGKFMPSGKPSNNEKWPLSICWGCNQSEWAFWTLLRSSTGIIPHCLQHRPSNPCEKTFLPSPCSHFCTQNDLTNHPSPTPFLNQVLSTRGPKIEN